jgi:hypothetical protein
MEAMRVEESRALTDKERLLLERLMFHGTPASKSYAAQLPLVAVVSRCTCGCPSIDLSVGGRVASLGSPTTILGEAGGVSPEGISFGIILHGREGLISELEVYPIDGEGVLSIPGIDDIRFDTRSEIDRDDPGEK